MSFSFFSFVRNSTDSCCQAVIQHLRRWTKPDNHTLALNAALDLTRSKSELVLENMLLRQQVIVLQRQVKRPQLTRRDRTFFVLLSSRLRTWKQSLVIVQPDTVLTGVASPGFTSPSSGGTASSSSTYSSAPVVGSSDITSIF
jgi:hypothetical protein